MSEANSISRLAFEAQIDEQRLNLLFDTLRAPASLTRLRLVLLNLQTTIQAGQELHSSLFDGLDADIFSTDDIDRLLGALGTGASTSFKPDRHWIEGSAEPRGIIKEHPEWAMLIIGRSNPIRQQRDYFRHLYIALYCSILQRRRHEKLGSEIDVGCLVLRKLATGKTPASTIFEISDNWSLSDYLRELKALPEDVFPSWSGLELLVRKIEEKLGKTRFVSGRKVGGSVVERIERADADDPNPEGPVSELHIYQSQADPETKNQARASGLHPAEVEDLRAVGVGYSKASPTANFDLRDHARRQTSQIQHLSSLNQRLPFRYQQLTETELAIAAALPMELIQSAQSNEIIEGNAASSNESELDEYVAALIQILLWLGRPLNQLLDMRFYQQLNELPKTIEDIAYISKEDVFVLPIRSPEWKRKLSENDRYLLERVGGASKTSSDHRIIVSSPIRFRRIANLIERKYCDSGAGRAKYFFPSWLHGTLEARLRKVLWACNRQNDVRLTPLRISQALFDEITTLSTDWVDASLITGHVFTITEVASHYYSISGDDLQILYHAAVDSLRSRLAPYLRLDNRGFYDFEQTLSNEADHGSKLNVKPQLVKKLVQHFKHELAMAKRRELGVTAVHNALTTYISFWVLFCTGYRAVNDLIFKIQEIDWESGLLVISDKDDDYQSNSRVVWLPPKLLQQIDLYMKHIEVMQTKLHPDTPAWLHVHQLLREPTADVPLLFFIREDRVIQRLTPESLRQHIEGYTLPINIGRHYLRPRLRALGCHAEYVNAYLGHWQIGQEPFGRYSSMSPLEMVSQISPFLESLRLEAGWTPQAGFASA
ncbi:MAG: site-specific integrase [Zhongshania sp.]|nr:site-specific integrase [Zhongshania sp.]